ncbi:hypothetical protein HMP09_1770 [Sphingomonas sp. HMP9]|uniref:YegP family protein n=1 Tax=Sphingomonas sp. HMP9 TaxID=1517554 RepID=UPI001596C427|nr:hypothetical protein HMP09_1770 [Sphingomonas sp. HMP9]
MSRPFPSYWIYRDNRNEWRWTYEASNGRTIAVSSEGYVHKADCQRGIDLLKASNGSPVWTPTKDLNIA